MPWDAPDPTRDERRRRSGADPPSSNRPVSNEQLVASLERETDRSLREDPSRWVLGSASEGSSYLARTGAGDDRSRSPYAASRSTDEERFANRSRGSLAGWEKRRASRRQAEES